MPQCPDCDSIKMFSLEPQGDGKCSACHGTGFESFLAMILDSASQLQSPCEECQGTGKCPTCAGDGLVEEFDLKLVA